MPGRRRAVGGAVEELLLVDLARRQLAPAAPDHRARPDQLAVMPAIEHRPARQHDRRNINGRRRHDARRRGLVAAGGQNDGIDRIAVQRLDQPQIRKVAIECRSRPAAILEDRMDRKFHGDPARIADPLARPLGELEMDAVARRKVAARLRDADDRPSRAQLRRGQPVIHEAFEVERGHVRAGGISEPVARSERLYRYTVHCKLS